MARPLRVVANVVARTGDSAAAVLDGLAASAEPIERDASIFDALEPDDGSDAPCDAALLNETRIAETVRARLERVAMPCPLAEAEQRLERLIS